MSDLNFEAKLALLQKNKNINGIVLVNLIGKSN